MTHRRARWSALVALLVPGVALAVDVPVGVGKLLLRDAGDPATRAARVVVKNAPALDPPALADPTVGGATLEVSGTGPGDGTTGVLALDASFWSGLGTPPGSKGWKFLDRNRTTGVKKIVLKTGALGGSLKVSAGGASWPYAMAAPQEGPIELRLGIGGDVVCGRAETFLTNTGVKLKAKDAPAPASCAPAVCGNGVVEGIEECDDGGTTSGDGCSNACRLEDASALCAGVPSTPGTALATVRVAAGLDAPVHVAAPPLDPRRLFVVEQPGRIRIVKDGQLLALPFLDIEGEVSCCGERGLLSIAFHPDYETNRYFFVNYTDNGGATVIARYEADENDPDRAHPASELVLLTIPQPFANHNGGQLAFAPDGTLYAGMGDGGFAGDPGDRAQDPGELLGKMLRLDVDLAGPPWAAATNPFNDGGATDPLDEIWALGFRNPWRFSFDRATGDLYVGDVGQNQWEEVSVEPAASTGGENYGWDVFEGDGHCFEGDPGCATPENYVMPVLEYPHAEGCSVTGGFVYRGCALPDLHGTYFYGDFCTAFIRTFEWAGGMATDPQDRTAELAPGGGLSIDNISSFGEDARGELHVVDLGGEVFRIVPAP